jgi:hypothetical protein
LSAVRNFQTLDPLRVKLKIITIVEYPVALRIPPSSLLNSISRHVKAPVLIMVYSGTGFGQQVPDIAAKIQNPLPGPARSAQLRIKIGKLPYLG